MANLWTGTVDTQGEYVNFETISELTFTADTTYTIQSHQGNYYLREGETGEGFLVTNLEKVQYTAGVDDLYIKTLDGIAGPAIINIAD